MEKHIIALLKKNLRVIIPDFGAFIVRQKEPEIIVFNEFLRYNDSLLTDHIAKEEQLDNELAVQKVSDFAEESSKVLESGKPLEIKGLGSLVRDASGKIHFTEEGAGRPGRTGKAAGKTPEQATGKKVSVPVAESDAPEAGIKAARSGPEVAADRGEAISGKKAEAAVEKKAETVAEKKAEAVAEKKVAGPEIKTEGPASEKVTAGSLEREAIPSTATRKSSTINQILIWVGIFLIANIIVFAWFLYKDQIRTFFGKEGEVVMMTDTTEADSILPDTDEGFVTGPDLEDTFQVPQQDAPMVRQTQVSPIATPSRQKYYIVAGCFREESNADALVQALRGQGFNAEKFGNIGNLHAVSYASFENQAEALKELERIRQEEQPEAWMTRF